METSENCFMNPYDFNSDHVSNDGNLKKDVIELRSNLLLKCNLRVKLSWVAIVLSDSCAGRHFPMWLLS